MKENIDRIPENVKMIDPVKKRSHYNAIIGQIDDKYWAIARQYHLTLTSEARDGYERIVHRCYFDGLREILQLMNEDDFLDAIDVNRAHLSLRLKLCAGSAEVVISPDMDYDVNWVSDLISKRNFRINKKRAIFSRMRDILEFCCFFYS